MLKSTRFLLVGIMLFFSVRSAVAECCWCECDSVEGCHCPMGMDWGGGDHCSNPCVNVDCSYCDADVCVGYGDCPSGVGGTGKKCKEVVDGCSASNCHKYEVCNTSNGAITYEVSGLCHLESGTCYSNERNCKDFNVRSIDWGGEWNNSHNSAEYMVCNKNEQSGTALWQDNKWNISDCRCAHTGAIWRKQCHGKYILGPRYNTVSNVDALIEYGANPKNYYCDACSAGMLPAHVCIEDSSYLCYNMDSTTTQNVVCECQVVSAPYYAPGANISYPFDANVTSGCHDVNIANIPSAYWGQCPNHMVTLVDGASSSDDCVPDGHSYRDQTGSFILGTTAVCNP